MDIDRPGSDAIRVNRGSETKWSGAKARLDTAELIEIAHAPKFPIPRTAPIFTMGSCFTRVIERTLIALDRNILLKKHGLPVETYEPDHAAMARASNVRPDELDRTCFNKYTVPSMSHELQRVLLYQEYENQGLIELADGKWFDPHASSLDPCDLGTALRNRQAIHDGISTIRNAGFVIFTLGLTESWIDTVTGLAMNAPPSGRWLASRADRFRFIDYGYDSILAEFLGMIDLIRRTCNPDMKFVVTVSPVPMSATFRGIDVIVAHTASKSVLRAVADEAQRRLDYVDYFPAYEIVMHSPRHLVWQEDQLHVARSVTQHIARQFLATYEVQENTKK